MIWTKQQARDFVVNYQMINTKEQASIMDVFARIKTIQMDPLNVVGMNPELALQSRVRNYKQGDIFDVLYKKRDLIDGWEKQMSIYETIYFPHFTRQRKRRILRLAHSYETHLKMDCKQLNNEVLDIIKQNGPMFSSQIKIGKTVDGYWKSNKQSTAAIDFMFHQGLIGVHSRNNTQKRYELIERLIPNWNQTDPFLTDDEFYLWYLYRRINTVGLLWDKSTIHFQDLHMNKRTQLPHYLVTLEEKGLITKLEVNGIKGAFYIPSYSLNLTNTIYNKISFIAPLDNLIWDRELLKELYQFDYIWEVYTPIKKRKWGYYVLPILRGSRFIGRIEFHKHRNNDPLHVKQILLEDHIKETKQLKKELQIALNRFATYLGANGVVLA